MAERRTHECREAGLRRDVLQLPLLDRRLGLHRTRHSVDVDAHRVRHHREDPAAVRLPGQRVHELPVPREVVVEAEVLVPSRQLFELLGPCCGWRCGRRGGFAPAFKRRGACIRILLCGLRQVCDLLCGARQARGLRGRPGSRVLLHALLPVLDVAVAPQDVEPLTAHAVQLQEGLDFGKRLHPAWWRRLPRSDWSGLLVDRPSLLTPQRCLLSSASVRCFVRRRSQRPSARAVLLLAPLLLPPLLSRGAALLLAACTGGTDTANRRCGAGAGHRRVLRLCLAQHRLEVIRFASCRVHGSRRPHEKQRIQKAAAPKALRGRLNDGRPVASLLRRLRSASFFCAGFAFGGIVVTREWM
mmetsp:Transcript_83828/g.233859  ORF Transcript_83828/g.233859 Transcript_83828/m.233859 type:complete len:357 (+) Transcript_83828:477-1547(+)